MWRRLNPLLGNLFYSGERFPMGLPVSSAPGQLGDFKDERLVIVTPLVVVEILRHPDTPWYAKLVGTIVVAHAVSPLDLIPDFVPVLGYVDDLILLPVGILLVV